MRKATFENIFTYNLTALPFILKEEGPNLYFTINCYQAREEQANARKKTWFDRVLVSFLRFFTTEQSTVLASAFCIQL